MDEKKKSASTTTNHDIGLRKTSLISANAARRQSGVELLARKASMYKKAAKRLFSKKVMMIIHEDQNKKYMLEKNKSPTEILVEEIKKPKKMLIPEKKGAVRRFTLDEGEEEKDIDRICYILKNVPGFKRFMIYNNVDDEAIRVAANFLTYHKVNKGEYVFKQGDVSKHFYGIIHGKISIRLETKIIVVEEPVIKRKNYMNSFFRTALGDEDDLNYENFGSGIPRVSSAKPVTKEVIKEEEILCRTDGYCFGEWGLIYRAPRSSSAYAVEDTELFILDEDSFNLSFNKCLSKAEIDRKNFLLKRISPFSDLQFSKFHTVYKTIVPMFLTKGQLVYLENTPADRLFVVYMGGCLLEKNVNNLPEDMKTNINKMKFTQLLKIDKGDIIGYESIMSTGSTYKYTLKSDSDYTVLLSVKVEKLDEPVKDRIRNHFKPHCANFEKNLENILQKKHELALRTKITYNKDLLIKQMNNYKMTPEEEKIFQDKVDAKVKEVQKLKTTDKNQGFKSLQLRFKDKQDLYKKFVNQTKYFTERMTKPHENFSNKLLTLSKFVEGNLENEKESLKKVNRNKAQSEFMFDKKNEFLHFLTLSTEPNADRLLNEQISHTRLNKNNSYSQSGIVLTQTNENTAMETNGPLTTRDSITGTAETSAKRRLLLKFDKTRTQSALVGSSQKTGLERKRNLEHKKTVTILTTDAGTNTCSNGTPRNPLLSFNYTNTEPSPLKNLDRLNSLISLVQEGAVTKFSSRPQSFVFSHGDSLSSNPKLAGALHSALHRRRKGISLVEKKNLLLQKNFYSYEKDPIIVSKPLKSNIKNWNNVVVRGASFNTGKFDIPLVGGTLN